MRPNLFEFATSELSQDAVLAWLLAWADHAYKSSDPRLHGLAQKLIFAFLKLHEINTGVLNHTSVHVRRQVCHVDIVVEVGDDVMIGIEDKTDTEFHSGHTKAIKELRLKYPGKQVLPIFLKTGDQVSYENVTSEGFKPFLRADLLAILCENSSLLEDNAILSDFTAFLEKRESGVNEWKYAPVQVWLEKPALWIGFYERLKQEFADLYWKYVPNATGGFIGAWWNWRDWNGVKIYLQINQGPLQFRIQGLKKELNYRTFCGEVFLKLQRLATAKNIKISKTHIHHGNTMAIAEVEMLGWLMPDSDGKIDLQSTLQRLKAAGEVIRHFQVSSRPTDGAEPGSTVSFCPPGFEDVAKAQEWILTGTGTLPSLPALACTVDGYARHPGVEGLCAWARSELSLLETTPIELFSTQNLLDLLFYFNRAERFVEGTFEVHAIEIDRIVETIARRVTDDTIDQPSK